MLVVLGYFSYLPALYVSNYCLLNEDENYETEKAIKDIKSVDDTSGKMYRQL
jgi:hypothetical protein